MNNKELAGVFILASFLPIAMCALRLEHAELTPFRIIMSTFWLGLAGVCWYIAIKWWRNKW